MEISGPRLRRIAVSCAFLSICLAAASQAETAPSRNPAAGISALPDAPASHLQDSGQVTIAATPVHILKDQATIWTSPARIRAHDLVWLAPLAAVTGVTLATDHHIMTAEVSHNPQFNHDNVNASNVMLATLIAVPVINLGYGEIGDRGHAREAGILGGETVVDAAILEQGMKLIFWRERPGVDNANGRFWQSAVGTDSSMPSSHAVFAWATAAEIAGEYPSPWCRLGVYSLATGVSLTRVLGQEHFPSDVLVGGAVGWLAGHYVYKVRHRWRRVR